MEEIITTINSKSKDQIETAQSTIENLQDYIELAKVQKKLKDTKRAEKVGNVIEDTIVVINKGVAQL